nr:hypothetical protein [Candidatus Bathyarchaeota archaeon]
MGYYYKVRIVRNWLEEITKDFFLSLSKPLWRRVLWVVTLVLSLGFGFKVSGWLAFAIFVLGTFLYEKSVYVEFNSELIKMLNNLAQDLDVQFYYPSYRVFYEIREDFRDFVIYDMKIKAVEKVVVAGSMFFGAQGKGAREIKHFRDLRIHAKTDKGKVHVFPLGPKPPKRHDQTRRWAVNVFFTEPILPGEARSLVVSGFWPWLWADLWETGEDSGSWFVDKFTEELQIIVTFPRGVEEEDMEVYKAPVKFDELEKEVKDKRDTQGRLQKVLIIKKATPGEYKYQVTCPELPRRLKKKSKTV